MEFPTEKKHIAIIDFEATCSNKGEIPREETEIIEFACVVVDRELNEVARFSEFVQPVIHPRLTNFCLKLTSIKQRQVDLADPFPRVLEKFVNKIVSPFHPLFASWGAYDKNQLKRDCNYHGVPYPFDNEHLDIKRWIPRFYEFRKPKSIGQMLHYLGMEFIGTPHRGIDDVENIIRILRVTQELEIKRKEDSRV